LTQSIPGYAFEKWIGGGSDCSSSPKLPWEGRKEAIAKESRDHMKRDTEKGPGGGENGGGMGGRKKGRVVRSFHVHKRELQVWCAEYGDPWLEG